MRPLEVTQTPTPSYQEASHIKLGTLHYTQHYTSCDLFGGLNLLQSAAVQMNVAV
jgi:hypothetical protein